MKKKSFAGRELFCYSPWLKRLLIMKMIVILILVAGLTSSFAKSDAQTTKLNLKFKSGTVRDVIEEIERQTDLSFMYDNNVFRVDRPISIDVENESVKSVVEKLIAGENLKYELVNRYIVITSNNPSVPAQQQKTVSGKVTDSSGSPLPGVSVVVKGTTTGSITDGNGNYHLSNVPAGATLQFTFVGMKPAEVAIGNKTVINAVLSEETYGIDEVVAIGYGTMKKGDVTGALSVVSSKEFESRSTTQLGDALEGKIAGVQISKPSGQPQAGNNIRIRGISTITAGSEPLYIVDGVPSSSINEIDPTDIESISILKDASSAAIYGASGSNGVVLVTTKRGSNQPTKVNFNAYYGMANVWKKQDVLNASQYKELMTEMGKTTDWSLYPYDNNWQDQVFRSAETKNSQISISGGNEKTSFYLSGSYLNQQGIVITNSLEKYNFRVNLDHKINDHIKVGTSVSYSRWADVNVGEGGKWSVSNAIITGSPVTNVYNEDGTFAINPFISDLENPVALLLQDDHKNRNHRFNGNAFAEISFLKDLKFKSMFGIEEQNGDYNSWIDPIHSRWGRTNQGLASFSQSHNFYWISENTLNYNKVISKHTLGAMVGFTTSKHAGEGSSIDAKGFGSPSVHTVNAGATRNSGYWETARSNVAVLGRINYSYADKYLLTANFRADASSVFGANSKWGYFPSFSAGWRISKEDFFGQNNLLTDLKIRAGWGVVGNDQVGEYSSFGLVSPGAFYVFGGQKVPGTAISTMENNDLKWEQTAQTNVGLDASLINNRITVTADYYYKKTTDMLLNSPIPGSIGMGYSSSTATKNIGSMTNKGLEFQVNSKNLVGALKWTTDFNISFNRSKITKLDKGVPIKTGYISYRGNVAIAEEGQPLGMFFGYVADGVDPQTGLMKYKDLDNTGDLSDGDQTLIGNANPKFIYGLTNSFNYKNFTLSIFFQGVQGNDIFNASRIETEGMYLFINQRATVLNRWKKPGDITDVPKSSGDGDDHNSLLSSRYVENGSYLRLKSLTLGYDLPKSLCNKLKLQKIYFYVTGENLLTFTKYSGFDPEVSIYGSGTDNSLKNIAPGVDYGVYPQARNFLFGINLSF